MLFSSAKVLFSVSFYLFCGIIGNSVLADFRIPLPFGSIAISKGENNQTKVGINNGLNILGNGAESGMTFNVGKGTFSTESNSGILVKGKKFGTNSTFGVDKSKGITADTDLNLGNDTVHGGVGKEGTFISELVDTIRKRKEERNRNRNRSR